MKSSSNALDPTFGFTQYLDHLQFLEYLLGVEHERGKNTDGRRSVFDVIQSIIRAVAGQRARLLLTFVKHKAKPDQ